MFDNSVLFVGIFLVIILIYKLNLNKISKCNKETFEVYATPSSNPVPYVQFPDQTIINNVLSNIDAPVTNTSVYVSKPVENLLNSQYSSNLKGSSSSVESNSTNTAFTADYGQGYNLGVNVNDPNLSRFTSQAPPQKTPLISDDLLPKKYDWLFEFLLVNQVITNSKTE